MPQGVLNRSQSVGCAVNVQRVPLYDNLRLFAMTLVILSHAVDKYPELYRGGNNTTWGGVIMLAICVLCVIRMPIFAIISGLLFRERDNAKLLGRYLYPCVLFSILEIMSWHISCGQAPWLTFGWSMWYLWSLFWYAFITPILLRHCSLNVLFVISFVLAVAAGFTPLEYTFQLSRLVTFYPFFLVGIWLQKYQDKILDEHRYRGWWKVLLISILIATAALFYMYPHVRHYLNFAVPYYNVCSMFKRILMYSICGGASVSLIMACKNRVHWFTKYGVRTLNVYLCHMAFVIFPISFSLTQPIMNTWYGYLINLICVPLICCVFYTDVWDKLMSYVLLKRLSNGPVNKEY